MPSYYKREGRIVNGRHRHSAEYELWQAMKARCLNPKNPSYHSYGGRGITIDPSWMDFDIFLADMGRRPNPKLTLERIDNNKGYCKDNCKWATRGEQAWNTRKFIRLHANDYQVS